MSKRRRTKKPALAFLKELKLEIDKFHNRGQIAIVRLEWLDQILFEIPIRQWSEWERLRISIIREFQIGNKLLSFRVCGVKTAKIANKYTLKRKRNEIPV